MIFSTASGTKTFDLASKSWTYQPDSSARFSVVSPRPALAARKQLGIRIPEWAPNAVYRSAEAVSGNKDALWIMTSLANEGAYLFRQDLIDIKNRRVYELPYEEFTTFLVEGRSAWVGGPRGLCQVDLDTGKRVNYHTLPQWERMTGHADTGKTIYYLSFRHGLFSVDTGTSEIETIAGINSYAERGHRFFDLLSVEGKLYLLAHKMDLLGNFIDKKETIVVLIFDPHTRTVSEVDAKIAFAGRLILDGMNIIGYGSYLQGYEGGEEETFGGAFSLSVNSGQVTVLSEYTIVTLELKQRKALSVDLTEQLAIIRHLEGAGPGQMEVSRTEWIMNGDEDYQGGEHAPDVVYKADRARYEDAQKLLAEVTRAMKPEREKKALEVLGKLMIVMKTVGTPAEPVKIEQY